MLSYELLLTQPLFLGSAAPNEGAANATNECVGKCPKGVRLYIITS